MSSRKRPTPLHDAAVESFGDAASGDTEVHVRTRVVGADDEWDEKRTTIQAGLWLVSFTDSKPELIVSHRPFSQGEAKRQDRSRLVVTINGTEHVLDDLAFRVRIETEETS